MNKFINILIRRVGELPGLRFSLLLLYLIPVLAILWFVNNFGVNIPSWDQWEFVHFFQKVDSGSAGFQDFFALHNEHRILFPKLIITALAFASGWNITYEFYVSILLTIITYICFIKIAAGDTKTPSLTLHVANIATGVMLFSFIQWESWLFGLGMVWFLINTCLALCIFCLSPDKRPVWISLLSAATCCIVASFSLANGLLTWLVVTPLLFYLPISRKHLQTIVPGWILLFILSCIVYFTGYQKPTYHPDSLFALKHPLLAADYFFTLLGSPLLYRSSLVATFGFLIFLNYVFFVIRYLQNPLSLFSRHGIPWIALGLFSVLSCLITTVGRAGFGVEQASSPRYTTFSILLLIAVVYLWRSHFNATFKRASNYKPGHLRFGSRSISPTFLAITGTLTVCVLITSINAIGAARKAQANLLYGRDCLQVAEAVGPSLNPCLSLLYFDGNIVKERAKALGQIGFWHTPPPPNFVTASDKTYGYIDQPPTTGNAAIVRRNCINCGDLELAGWAILPDRKELPHLILLSYGNGTRTFFATAQVKLPSPDIAKAYRSNRYGRARWSIKIAPKLLPFGDTVISAWVYDSVANQLVKLNGEPGVRVEE